MPFISETVMDVIMNGSDDEVSGGASVANSFAVLSVQDLDDEIHPDRRMAGVHGFVSERTGNFLEYVVYCPDDVDGFGPDDEFILIQCPGWGIGSEYLERGLSVLWSPSNESDKAYICVFLRPRGTGESYLPIETNNMSSMPDMASDVDDLRLYLRVYEIPILLGHGAGGTIALGYAEMYPLHVTKLILINHQLLGVEEFQVERMEETKDDPAYRGAWYHFQEDCVETYSNITEAFDLLWPLYFYDPVRYLDVLVDHLGQNHIIDWTAYRWNTWSDTHLSEPDRQLHSMQDVVAKTLVIYGQDDLMNGPLIPELTTGPVGIRNSQLVEYEECGHFPWIEQSDRTFNDIRRFIQGLELGDE